MNKAIISRLDKLAAKIGNLEDMQALCTMRDGKRKILDIYTAFNQMDDGEVIEMRTANANFYKFFGGLYPGKIILTSRF